VIGKGCQGHGCTEAENIRVAYLGKKGLVNGAMSFMRLLSPEDKPKLGQVVNAIKEELEERVTTRKKELEIEEIELRMEEEKIDVTMPGLPSSRSVGKRHPLSITMEKAVEIFIDLGYDTVRVTVVGYDGEPATENQIIKKKMLETIFPDLKTNNQGVATYKGIPLSTSAGECIAQDNLANSPVG
jgi:Aminoacyl tRNA synthetase class II, N-terminal domain